MIAQNTMSATDSAATGAGATSTAAASSQSVAAKVGAMGKDQFLTLLVAQLKNQDPTNPVDNSQFTSQMAQFSSLEQLMGINDAMGLMTSAVNSANTSQAINLIGKEVTAQGHNVYVKGGQGADVTFEIPDTASGAKIIVEDAAGNVVRTIDKGSLPAGKNTVAWDGTADDGSTLPDGLYTYTVLANDSAGNLMDVSTYTRGIATGVSYDGGVAYVTVGNQKYMLSEIVEVHEPKAAA
ncbi:MAG: hypothetical protein HQK87_00375 [Nitrospinae bacterium]|nr:hypothetical protein [Nitrospinota bacterium]